MSQQRPHVSAAIQSLRPIVTAAAVAVIVCATVQMLVFGFVHFTDVRWEKTERPVTAQDITVVTSAGARQAPKPAAVDQKAPSGAEPARRTARRITDVEAAAAAQAPSKWAPMLQQFSAFAVVVGAVSTIAMAWFVSVGAVIAGGGSVPGVEKAVKALGWAVLLALFALPWSDVLPAVPFAGIFGDYTAMVAASDAVDAGTAAVAPLLANHLVLPLIALALAGMIALNFRAGVERGIIVTSVSELDRAIEREMDQIKARGIGSNVGGGRTIGTLNRAIGDQSVPEVPAAPPLPAPGTRPAPAPADATESDPAKGRSWVSPADRRMNQPTSGNPLRRLV
jgi:hypothetical protein